MNYTHITNVSKQRILIFRRNMPSISLALGQSITIPTNVIDRSQIMNLKDKRFIRVYSTGESVTISDTGSIRDGINAVASSGNVDINQGAMATALAIKNTQSLIDLNIANAAATPAVNEASIKAAVQAVETQARDSVALAATPPVATGGDAATIAGLIEVQAARAAQPAFDVLDSAMAAALGGTTPAVSMPMLLKVNHDHSPMEVDANTLALYRLHESWADLSGNGRDLTLRNDPTITPVAA